jgi:plastocyanin
MNSLNSLSLYTRVGLLLLWTAGAGAFLPHIVDSREPAAEEIRVVAKNMTYYANGAGDANPAIQLPPGRLVRITFRNDDRGMLHDFSIPAFGVGSGIVEYGAEKSFTFRVPDRPAAATYTCTPHSAMMSGRILFAK